MKKLFIALSAISLTSNALVSEIGQFNPKCNTVNIRAEKGASGETEYILTACNISKRFVKQTTESKYTLPASIVMQQYIFENFFNNGNPSPIFKAFGTEFEKLPCFYESDCAGRLTSSLTAWRCGTKGYCEIYNPQVPQVPYQVPYLVNLFLEEYCNKSLSLEECINLPNVQAMLKECINLPNDQAKMGYLTCSKSHPEYTNPKQILDLKKYCCEQGNGGKWVE